MAAALANIISSLHNSKKSESGKSGSKLPDFKPGDTVKVHARIVEGNKERVQIFEGVVISRRKGNLTTATFTVRKISYGVGVERTFLLHSPRIDKIEIVSRGKVRRAKLFYLRKAVGKAGRIKSQLYTANRVEDQDEDSPQNDVGLESAEEPAQEEAQEEEASQQARA